MAAQQTVFPTDSSVDPEEVSRFSAMAQDWWDSDGAHAPLHAMSPTRMAFLRREILRHSSRDETGEQPFAGLQILDIGCGGGLVAEPLARLGATVVAIDADDSAIAVARQHASAQNLTIDYRCMTAEDLAKTGQRFDIVTCLEVVEHVANLDAFLGTCVALLHPNGLLVLSTINRTRRSRLLAITLAESILRIVPPGTHDWDKFRRPDEIAATLSRNGARLDDLCGMTWSPVDGTWSLTPDDVSVNYLLTAVRS
jgi:2-polyprenyl-6-hydroxyphenyl methylase/3-demethylubiquinone-9 3-methyltransferase